MTDLIVLVPTRSRPHSILPIIQQWYATGAFGVADLCFIVDADDPQLEAYLDAMVGHPPVQRFILPEWQPLVPKLNRVAVQAAKDYPIVAFMGDDHLPRTQLWAHQLVKEGIMHRPSITYGQDGHQNEDLPTWWSMSSDVITALGSMVPSPVQHLFCDNTIKVVGERAGILRYVESILIEHMHPAVGKAPVDEQYSRVNRPQQYERDQDSLMDWAKDGGIGKAVAAIRAIQ